MKALKDMSQEELWQLFPIILREHRRDYADWYHAERGRLLHQLRGQDIRRISHIGSTSVPGLLAKPIVDILLELPQAYPLDDVAGLLQKDGWIVMARDDSASTLDLNKGYTPSGFAEKVFHLHVKPSGDWDELYFRDYLRSHPDTAQAYGALKQSLQERYEHNRDAYTAAKTDFVRDHTQKARSEFGGRYLPATPGSGLQMTEKNRIGIGRAMGAAMAAALLLAGFLLCRYAFFELHGMREWPRNVFLLGLVAIAVAAVFDARIVMLCTPAGYLLGFAAAMLLRTDGLDPGGGSISNDWALWTGFFLAAIAAGIVAECMVRRKKP